MSRSIDEQRDANYQRLLAECETVQGLLDEAVELLTGLTTSTLAYRHADARLEGAQEAGRNYRAQLETLRSINSNLRALVVGS